MTAYLGETYIKNLSKEEEIEINIKAKESRKEFARGFAEGVKISFQAYSLNKVTLSVVYVIHVNKFGSESVRAFINFVPRDARRGVFLNGTAGIFKAGKQNGDFAMGVAFGIVLGLGVCISNRFP